MNPRFRRQLIVIWCSEYPKKPRASAVLCAIKRPRLQPRGPAYSETDREPWQRTARYRLCPNCRPPAAGHVPNDSTGHSIRMRPFPPIPGACGV